jgi:hypothetical protein
MVRFADRVCGLVFPPFAADQAGIGDGVFARVLSGDYAWDMNPADASTWGYSHQSALEQRAVDQANVRIDLRSGEVVPEPGASLASVALPALSASGLRAACPKINSPITPFQTPQSYRVIRTNVDCGVTREIVWAYNDEEGAAVKRASAGGRLIVGWLCTGTRIPREPQSEPSTSGHIECANGTQQIDVEAELPALSGPWRMVMRARCRAAPRLAR